MRVCDEKHVNCGSKRTTFGDLNAGDVFTYNGRTLLCI
jgi:hypothetical protein